MQISPAVMLSWQSAVGKRLLIGSHTFAVVVVVLVVLDTVLVVAVLVEVVLVEDVVEDVVKVLPLKVVEVVRELLVRVIELVLEELVVDVVIVELVISHSLQAQHVAHVHSSDHAKVLLWQPFAQSYIALVVVPRVAVIPASKSIVVKVVPGDPPPPPELPPELPPLPPLPQTSVVVVNVFVVVPSVDVEREEVNVVVVRKLKFEGGGCVVGGVGTTMLAHCPHVAQTAQPHLTNHGCPLGSQSSRHWSSCGVVVLVTGPMVIVFVRVVVVELIVVVVQTGTSRTSGVNSSV
mmetsp:Transcript_95178/g.248305  ORF Transcript_95178/g.248305 Transcript_95178/m.248305 type:complete len:292 (+) Transcript_95178:677-1552(+)